MSNDTKRHVTTLCKSLSCDFCPEVFVDDSKESAKQISITDDFGNEVYMSKEQFSDFVQQSREGKLDI